MYDVITVGSSTIDVFAGVKSELIKIKTIHHEEELIAYPCGSKILINKLGFLTGGGGTNTAVCFSRLGLKVAYLGMMGNRSNSKLIQKELHQEKIKFLGIQSRKYHTGYSIILESLESDRTILAYKGANNHLKYKSIDLKKLKTKWFYFSSMVDESYATLEKLAKFAVENNIKIAFNPSNYLAEKGYHYLKEVISRTTLLVLNNEEAMLLAGRGSPEELIRTIMNFGPEIVVLTDGKKGAYTISKNKFLTVVPNKIKPVETTGAGDAFASTYLAGIINGYSVEDRLRFASLNASFVVQEKGAKNGLSDYKKLKLELKKHPPSIEKKK